jgi:membrane protein
VVATLPRWQWLALTIDVASSVVTFWFFMFVVYLWVPNARVRVRPALIGALVAAILLEVGKRSLGVYMANAFTVSSLYGSLGLIPVFMFWMYLMWMFVLVGLEVAAIVQVLRGRDARVMQTEELENLIDPASILSVMTLIATGFESGRTLSPDEVAKETGLPFKFTELMLERLEKRGFLHEIDQKQAFVLARAPEKITASQLMEVAFELVDDGAMHLQSPLVEALREAQRSRAENTTLEALIPLAAKTQGNA